MPDCAHIDSVEISELPEEVAGCEECLESGGKWCHLRICLSCGHVGCCDSSPGRHASGHADATGHPIMRSVQPGEDWAYCYVDRLMIPRLPQVQGSPTIPTSPLCP
jgi:uncharacterized UBP type Zn finger protein